VVLGLIDILETGENSRVFFFLPQTRMYLWKWIVCFPARSENLAPKSCTSENEKDNFFSIKALRKKQKASYLPMR